MSNRRTFLKRAALFAATSPLIETKVRSGGTVNDEKFIGHGEFRYKMLPGWGVLDSGINPVNNCHEMVEDHSGRIFLLTDETKNNVLTYDKSGKLVGHWGTSYPGAHGLTISGEKSDQFLLLTDTTRNQVIKTDLKGRELMKLDYPKEISAYQAPYQFKPTETAVNSDNGDIYVADGYGLNYIIQYSEKGKYISHFGGGGESLNENFDCCHGIVIDSRDAIDKKLLITDRKKNCLKHFGLDGKYMGTINLPGSYVCRPRIHQNNVFAAVFRSVTNDNINSGYVQILDRANRVVSTPGGSVPIYENNVLQPQQKDSTFSPFLHPHDVHVDSDENLYVAQWASGKIYPYKFIRV